jgi:ribonuclease HI
MSTDQSQLFINTDGGARGNPGPSAVGVVYTWGDQITEHARAIGTATNNVAEYQGILDALERLPLYLSERSAITSIIIRMDSELVVKQLLGQYRIKEPHLQQLAAKVHSHLQALPIRYAITHVLRAQNKAADRLVNLALDNAPDIPNVPISLNPTES